MTDIEKAVALFETVRDIPYGSISSRDSGQVLAQRRGTCSGKHLLLRQLFQANSLPVKLMMCRTTLNGLDVDLPDELTDLLAQGKVPDFHNYLRVDTGHWVDVDATFDAPLARHGFVVNEWDGRSDCHTALPAFESWEVEDLFVEKEAALASLSDAERTRRREFIDPFSSWLETLR